MLLKVLEITDEIQHGSTVYSQLRDTQELRRQSGFLLRSNTAWMNGYYTVPAGKVEKDEPCIKAAIRECYEEVGVQISEDNLKHVLTMHRKEAEDMGNTWVNVFFEATHYDGEPYNAEPHVHGELVWFDLDNLPDNVTPMLREALNHITQGDRFAERGWNS